MFSGSAVVDWRNTSGFGQRGSPPQVLIYTAAGHPAVQCLAYSSDGRNYAKFGKNPVVAEIAPGNRDPKVIRYEPIGEWVMALYVGLPDKTGRLDEKGRPAIEHTVHFLTSPNLKDWTVRSRVDGFYECPDIFELPVDGDLSKRKWVLTAASSEYVLGAFDGARFTPETPKLKGHFGRGFYAAQTFSDIPGRDGRRIQIGWLQAPSPGMPFNQAMSLPVELELRSTAEGPRIARAPVKELTALRARSHSVGPVTLKPGDLNPLAGIRGELVEVRAEFTPAETAEVVFKLRGATVSYNASKQSISVNDHSAPAPLREGRQTLVLYVDRTTLEVFAADGLTYVPMPFIPKSDDLSLELVTRGGTARFIALEVYELKSIWEPGRGER
jgi:fructan beta-fructosidase